jgi:hypothetical protein
VSGRAEWLARGAARAAVRVAIAAALAIALLAVVGGLTRARGERALLDLGARMLRYGDALVEDAPRVVELNGTRLWLAAGIADRPLDEVLGFFAARCRPGGDLAADLAELEAGAAAGERDAPAPLGGALRGGDAEHGFVACLDGGELGPEALVERARAFARSGDVGVLGDLRYVYGERRGGQTHYIGFWHQGRLVLRELFPAQGDAPGVDSPVAPRPPGARRLLSMREVGLPYTTTIYSGATEGIPQLADRYRRHLQADGWRLLAPRRPPADRREASIFAVRDGVVVVIVVGDDPAGVSTTIMTATPEELERRRER